MKHLIIIIFAIISIYSCKKNITEEKNHFLRGRLLTECNGTPVPHTEVQLWKDLKPSSFLSPEQPEKLLESTTSNADGFFYFVGDKSYIKNNTSAISNASVRLTPSVHTKIAVGTLGANSEYDSQTGDDTKNKNIGNVYLNGMTEITFKIASQNLNLTYDSVKVVPNNFAGPSLIITNSTSGYFNGTLNNISLNPKHFSSSEYVEHTKFFMRYDLFFYSNGNSSNVFYEYAYVNDCSINNVVQFDF